MKDSEVMDVWWVRVVDCLVFALRGIDLELRLNPDS